MSILITGGAGYIGSHVARLLRDRGDEIVIVDDLITGNRERVPDIPIIELDLAHADSIGTVEAILREYSVTSVFHFAGRKQVGESVIRPAWYYQQNVGALANLLIAMEAAEVSRIVFSSSAAVYGAPDNGLIPETARTEPINPYGESKLAGEWLISGAATAQKLRAASLRYFNVAGAGWAELGDTAVLNLVPMVFDRIVQGLPPIIFGDDYLTTDGTCVRDFIHVLDLADAHVATMDSLKDGPPRHEVYNVGTGFGASVREMIRSILTAAAMDLTPEIRGRRAGDPGSVVADPVAIELALGWKSKRGIDEIVTSAWESFLYNRMSKRLH
ncbi:UDP-glucose 4-epimerase GalE [Cryobacterium psychrophilum]|uniref:UDP-glucose 4-epimerase n=1 Tax=Cryobacterium psychrophilum TaxID=41988 RepID=A0A4Y8KSP0_9MICO|nr:UDP-glucose 4-epimerase GalE [Cryobacterium psychrophilum]TDW29784.1 UDP-galactose 4-epimerase [Cryobacterium psychrophilum]TFD81881.1 UDP-glucose 4-epimerase GalE [Cryobacterium psychrophilum]